MLFRKNLIYRVMACLIAGVFALQTILPAVAWSQLQVFLPPPGMMVLPKGDFQAPLMMGVTIDPNDPFAFDFLISRGDSHLPDAELEIESQRLIKYFLAALTVPHDEMWVNLSPDEPDRIIPQNFGYTEMGRDMLAQDYLLKQLTASLMDPEKEPGSAFWERIDARARDEFGVDDVPNSVLSRVWIVPEKAVVYEHENSAFVVSKHLKVMTEYDYLHDQKNTDLLGDWDAGSLRSDEDGGKVAMADIVREILIPEIEHEVNQGEHFANLRQIFNSMILAAWYKKSLKESLLGRVYVDQQKVKGVEYEDSVIRNVDQYDGEGFDDRRINDAQNIYNQYLEAFQKGVVNFLKEDYDPVAQQIIPRRYFSGGVTTFDSAQLAVVDSARLASDSAMASRVKVMVDWLVAMGQAGLLARVSVKAAQSPGDGDGQINSGEVLNEIEFRLLLDKLNRASQMHQPRIRLEYDIYGGDVNPNLLEDWRRGVSWDEARLNDVIFVLKNILGQNQARDFLVEFSDIEVENLIDSFLWGIMQNIGRHGRGFYDEILEAYPYFMDLEGHKKGKHLQKAAVDNMALPPLRKSLLARSSKNTDALHVKQQVLRLVYLQNVSPLTDEKYTMELVRAFGASYDLETDNVFTDYALGIAWLLSHPDIMVDFSSWHELGHNYFSASGLVDLPQKRKSSFLDTFLTKQKYGSTEFGRAIQELIADITGILFWNAYGGYGIDKYRRILLGLGGIVDLNDRKVFLNGDVGKGSHFLARIQLVSIIDAMGELLNWESLFRALVNMSELRLNTGLPQSVEDEIRTPGGADHTSVVEFTKLLLLEYLKVEGYEFSPDAEDRLMDVYVKWERQTRDISGFLIRDKVSDAEGGKLFGNHMYFIPKSEIRYFMDQAKKVAEKKSDHRNIPVMVTAPQQLPTDRAMLLRSDNRISIVQINLEVASRFGGDGSQSQFGMATGFPIGQDEKHLYIATNAHAVGLQEGIFMRFARVILKRKYIYVRHSYWSFNESFHTLDLLNNMPKVVSVDRDNDIAIVRMPKTNWSEQQKEDTVFAKFGSNQPINRRDDQLQVYTFKRVGKDSFVKYTFEPVRTRVEIGLLNELKASGAYFGWSGAPVLDQNGYLRGVVYFGEFYEHPDGRVSSTGNFGIVNSSDVLALAEKGKIPGMNIVSTADRAMSSDTEKWQNIRSEMGDIWREFKIQMESLKGRNPSLVLPVFDHATEIQKVTDFQTLQGYVSAVEAYREQVVERLSEEGGRQFSVATEEISDAFRAKLNKVMVSFMTDKGDGVVQQEISQEEKGILASVWRDFQSHALAWGYSQNWIPDIDIPESSIQNDLGSFISIVLGFRQAVLEELQGENRNLFLYATAANAESLMEIAVKYELSISVQPEIPDVPSKAMVAQDTEVGGIDFNPDRLDMEIRSDSVGGRISVDSAQLPDVEIEGLYPVIINITPVFNPLPLLGMNASALPATEYSRI